MDIGSMLQATAADLSLTLAEVDNDKIPIRPNIVFPLKIKSC